MPDRRLPADRARRAIWRAGQEIDPLPESALVFAPHQDDETLACGGTICRLVGAGATVRVVFMADGSTSHAHLINGQLLSQMRRAEAREACAVLGLDPDADVIDLSYPEGQLHTYEPDIVRRAADLLARWQPQAVFIPHHHDVHPDHIITNRAVTAALHLWAQVATQPVTVYEYPIWYWNHWPWMPPMRRPRRDWPYYVLRSLRGLAGWRASRIFRHYVTVGPVLDCKREALARHRSQMVRHQDNPHWPILADVGAGRWLACFFTDREIFHRNEIRHAPDKD